jgi:mono/diheme cytochrome c family protein
MGLGISVHRGGQGGEDDVGCEKAALRVYFNIGMCAAECMIPHLPPPAGAGGEIDDAQCSAACPDYVAAKAAVGDMCDFMSTTTAPKLEAAPGGASYVNYTVIGRGKKVFEKSCAGCHSNGQPTGADKILSDDLIHLQPLIGTNACRSLTTNWMEGRIWGQFSSDEYKARFTGGPGFYRDVPLHGVWSTAPFFHNNALGGYNGDPSVAGRIAAYEDAMDQLLNPWKRDLLGSIQVTSDWIQAGSLTLPAGTPVALFANANPNNILDNKCPDLVENQGHYYGALLSSKDKEDLIEFLKTK